jgi:hypothetical protein
MEGREKEEANIIDSFPLPFFLSASSGSHAGPFHQGQRTKTVKATLQKNCKRQPQTSQRVMQRDKVKIVRVNDKIECYHLEFKNHPSKCNRFTLQLALDSVTQVMYLYGKHVLSEKT